MRKFSPLLLLFFWASAVYGQALTAPVLTATQAQTLVERSLAAELRAIQNTSHPMRYRLRKSSPRLTSTKALIETRDGEVARLIALNDHPLSSADEQKEQARLNELLNNPGRQQHRKRSQEADTRIVLKLLRALPHAFLYEYKGHGQGSAARLERFTFHPDPSFNPPDMETQLLGAMSGEIWIDAAQERVTRLEGHLLRDTNYAWGILGRLNKGGWIVIEQEDIGHRSGASPACR